MKAEKGRIPLCMRPEGCEGIDVLPDLKLNRLVTSFIQLEGLADSPAYAAMADRILRESGLIELSPDLIFELKRIFAEWRKSQIEKPSGGKRT